MARTTYEVIVGNVGRVYEGTSKREADKVYHDYIEISRSGLGRAGGEEVTLFVDGEFADCYVPPYHDEDEYGYDDVGLDDIQMRERNPSGPAGIPDAFTLLKLHKQPTVDAHGHPIPPRPYSHLLICTFPAYIGHSSYAEWNEYEYLALNPSTGYIEGGRIDEHWMRRYLDGYEKIGKSIGITALPKGSREYAMSFISQQADRIAAWESATPRDQENFARPYHWLRDGGKGR